jgi:hypothetical protein
VAQIYKIGWISPKVCEVRKSERNVSVTIFSRIPDELIQPNQLNLTQQIAISSTFLQPNMVFINFGVTFIDQNRNKQKPVKISINTQQINMFINLAKCCLKYIQQI